MRAIKQPMMIAALASLLMFLDAGTGHAQSPPRRYEPSRPTVSPYLNLFRPNNNVIPNYQSLVRPEQQALRFRNEQRQFDRQQQRQMQQLQSNVKVLQQPGVNSTLVAPTGKSSWFNVPGGSQFGNTSSFYSQSNGAGTTGAATGQR
jgi:hypothetical protein